MLLTRQTLTWLTLAIRFARRDQNYARHVAAGVLEKGATSKYQSCSHQAAHAKSQGCLSSLNWPTAKRLAVIHMPALFHLNR
jgi:hypothetical protein